MPSPAFEADLGFADPRPFVWQGNLWCVSLVRQLNTGGRSEMVLSCVSRSSQGEHILRDWRVLPSGKPARDEKNWMPQVDGDELRLIYSVDPTRILSVSGTVLHDGPASVAAESFRGSFQAIDFDDGWLMVVHEVEQVNNRRRYFHRFVWMDAANSVHRISRQFYLRKPGVEFIAGMAWHPDDKRLVLQALASTTPTRRSPSWLRRMFATASRTSPTTSIHVLKQSKPAGEPCGSFGGEETSGRSPGRVADSNRRRP